MPHTLTKEAFKFDELDDSAKEKARDWYRQIDAESGDNFFAENVIEDAATIADMLGIDLRQHSVKLMGGGTRQEPSIWWSGFCHQDQGACFDASYSYAKGSCKAIRAYAPLNTDLHRIADELFAVQRHNGYRVTASVTSNSRSKSQAVSVDDSSVADGKEIIPIEEALQEAMDDFAHWIYRQLEKEYEWQNADEQVDDNIRANEYDFNEDGTRCRF